MYTTRLLLSTHGHATFWGQRTSVDIPSEQAGGAMGLPGVEQGAGGGSLQTIVAAKPAGADLPVGEGGIVRRTIPLSDGSMSSPSLTLYR